MSSRQRNQPDYGEYTPLNKVRYYSPYDRLRDPEPHQSKNKHFCQVNSPKSGEVNLNSLLKDLKSVLKDKQYLIEDKHEKVKRIQKSVSRLRKEDGKYLDFYDQKRVLEKEIIDL